MSVFQLCCHLNWLTLIKVIEINYMLPADYTFINPKVSFLQIIPDIFQEMWWVIKYKYFSILIFKYGLSIVTFSEC